MVGVDDHQLGRGVQGRRPCEPHREIHRLAEQHHEVGCRQHVGERAEGRIAQPPRALHRDHRDVKRGLDRRNPGAGPASIQAGTGEDDGPLRPGQPPRNVIGDRTRKRTGAACELRRPHPAPFAGRGIEHVERQRDVHRPGPPGARAGDGGGDVVSDPPCAAGTPRGLDERAHEVDLRHLLERAGAVGRDRGVAAQQQDRALGVPGGEERGEGVGESGSGGDQRDADLAGDLGPGVGHVHRRAFMADVDDGEVDVDARIVDRHDLVAGQAEDAPHPGAHEGVDQQPGAVHCPTGPISISSFGIRRPKWIPATRFLGHELRGNDGQPENKASH